MFRNYLTVAYRNLIRYKVYSAINITGLAIGIAFCILTFLYIRHEWSFDAFHEKADRIYRVYNKGEVGEGSDASAMMPGPLAPALAETFPTQMQHVVRINHSSRTLQYGDHPFQVRVIYIDPGFWDVFSFPLIKGDPATALNSKDAMIISETAAQKIFGNTDPMGKTISFTRNSKIHQALITGIAKDIPETSSIQFDCIQAYENVEDALNSWNYITDTSTYVLLHNQGPEDIEKLFPHFLIKGRLKIISAGLFSQFLVVFQIALSAVLVISAFIMTSQLDYLRTKPLGFDSEHLIAVSRLSKLRGLGPKGIETYRDALLSHHAILGVTPIYHMMRNGYQSRGAVVHDGTSLKGVEVFFVDYDFVPTLDIKLIEGRNYSRELVTDPAKSVIINQTLAKQLGPGPPLGKTLKFFDDMTVIGVVNDFHFRSLHHKIGPALLKCDPEYQFSRLLIRVRAEDIPGTLTFMEAQWEAVTQSSIFRYSFLDEGIDHQYRTEERWHRMIGYGTLFAIFIACLGAFGLTALAVTRRTKEIGIRKILGASVTNVVRLLSREFVLLVGIANVLAWPVAYWAMSKWLSDFAYRIELGIGEFALGGVLTLLVVIGTVSLQAIKAAKMNPVEALRYE